MANDFVQTMIDARVDARSLSDFVFKPAGFKVPRRLSTPVNTLDYYLQYLQALELVYSQPAGAVNINGVMVKSVTQAVKDALSAAVVGEGGISSALISTTTETLGQVARTQNSKNNDIVVVEDYGSIGDGTNHPLSERFSNLALAQAQYPFVTALTDSIDWAAAQAAANTASAKGYTLNLSGRNYFLNKPVEIKGNVVGNGAVIYTLGNSTFNPFTLTALKDIKVRGVEFKKLGVSTKRGYAIKVIGDSSNVRITDVIATEYAGVFHADGDDGSVNNAKHRVYLSNTTTGGSFRMGYYDPTALGEIKWTGAINYNSTAAQLQSIMDAAIGTGKVIVSGTALPKGALDLDFIGTWSGLLVQEPVMRFATSGSKSYGGSVTVLTAGGSNLINRITLDNVIARDSGGYGIQIDNARNVNFINCEAIRSWFDGVKLRKNVKGVTFLGGDYSYNGTSWFADGAAQETGDGIDCYAGGENITLIGTRLNNNNSAGIQIKNDDDTFLTGYGVGKFGMNRKVELIGVEACYNRVNSGISVTINSSTNPDNILLATDINIVGGRYEGNAAYGIQVAAGRAILTNAIANHNGLAGLLVTKESNYVELNNCIAVANGLPSQLGYGLVVAGRNVKVNGGMYYGVDTTAMAANTDYATLTPSHLANIRIEGTAKDVLINMVDEGYNASGRGIIIEQIGGVYPEGIIINQRPTEKGLIAGQSLVYGSVGSMFYKRDATQAGDQAFIKISGKSYEVGAWRRLGASSVREVTTSTTMTGNDTTILAVAQTAELVVTLPLVLGQIGAEYRVTKTSGANAVKVSPQGADQLNGGTNPATLPNISDTVLLVGTLTGWRIIDKSVGVTGV